MVHLGELKSGHMMTRQQPKFSDPNARALKVKLSTMRKRSMSWVHHFEARGSLLVQHWLSAGERSSNMVCRYKEQGQEHQFT